MPSPPLPAVNEDAMRQLLKFCDRIAWWLDDGLRIPGTRFRIGLDALIGIVPVAGDVAGFAISGYTIWRARRAGAPKSLLFKMGRNVAIDAAGSMVPIVGDAFDAVFKAHRRNFELLRREYSELAPPRPSRPRNPWTLAIIAGLVAIAGVIAARACNGP